MPKEVRARSQEKKNTEKLKLLFALIKGSRRSDRQLAKDLGLSQATIARRRQELENEGFIKEYTVIPDLKKMGFEIVAFTISQQREYYPPGLRARLVNALMDYLKKKPEIIYFAEGEGLGELFVAISVHRDYTSYANLIREVTELRERKPELRDMHVPPEIILSVRVNTGSRSPLSKPFSFRYLESSPAPE